MATIASCVVPDVMPLTIALDRSDVPAGSLPATAPPTNWGNGCSDGGHGDLLPAEARLEIQRDAHALAGGTGNGRCRRRPCGGADSGISNERRDET